MCVCMYLCMHVCMYVCMYVCICVCLEYLWVFICVCVYVANSDITRVLQLMVSNYNVLLSKHRCCGHGPGTTSTEIIGTLF
jgi:hypothetical protein